MTKPAILIQPALILALALAAFTGQARAAGEVALIKGSSIYSAYRGVSWQEDRFEVVVDDLAYAKQVAIHYKRADGTWVDYPLRYNRPASAGKEIWTTESYNSYLSEPSDPIEFAVKYQVNGATYWDNNGGANYRLKKHGGTLLSGVNVFNNYQAKLYASNGAVYGNLTLKNLSPTKQVEVVYSTDGWATHNKTSAYFDPYYWFTRNSGTANPNSHGFEEWNYRMDIGSANRVEYAFKYTVNGVSYWDNNFGRNYVSHIAH